MVFAQVGIDNQPVASLKFPVFSGTGKCLNLSITSKIELDRICGIAAFLQKISGGGNNSKSGDVRYGIPITGTTKFKGSMQNNSAQDEEFIGILGVLIFLWEG